MGEVLVDRTMASGTRYVLEASGKTTLVLRTEREGRGQGQPTFMYDVVDTGMWLNYYHLPDAFYAAARKFYGIDTHEFDYLWDLEVGDEVATHTGHTGHVIAPSQDGMWILVMFRDDEEGDFQDLVKTHEIKQASWL